MRAHIQQNRSPQKGLLLYLFYSAIGSLMFVFLLYIVMSAALFITGNSLVYTLLGGIGIVGPPYVVLMVMGGSRYAKWERYQLSMPINRVDLVKSQYLSMLLASLLGIPFVIAVTIIAYHMHDFLFESSLTIALVNISELFAVPLIMVALLFPLSSTKLGEGKEEGLSFICFLLAFATPLLISIIGVRLDFAEGVAPLLSLLLAVILFFSSYLMSKHLYSKLDF